ncbi:MAG TPA: hypothetical protein VH120_16460, partial [Gemmataceae bacterium]|nr:hypothetical protein [Gemmataceae bacterium]
MSEPILWLIPGLPLLAAAVTALFGPKYLRDKSHWPVLVGCFGACAIALWALAALIQLPHDGVHQLTATAVTWFSAGNLQVSYSIAVDP